jgi:crossover junction endodeoxyribonuclease RuvC
VNCLGIDPGMRGGIAYITDHHAEAVPMPTVGKQIDGRAIAEILKTRGVELVVIEKVGAMPGQGLVSTFTFGYGTGLIVGVLEALSLPYRMVTPQAWKGLVLAGTARDKEAAIQFVRRAYPQIDLTPGRIRTPHDGMADAVCLAEWGRRL